MGILKLFLKHILEEYSGIYGNRQPTKDEVKRTQEQYDEVGFKGCAGCLECMNLKWKNCPFNEKGQYYNSIQRKENW